MHKKCPCLPFFNGLEKSDSRLKINPYSNPSQQITMSKLFNFQVPIFKTQGALVNVNYFCPFFMY